MLSELVVLYVDCLWFWLLAWVTFGGGVRRDVWDFGGLLWLFSLRVMMFWASCCVFWIWGGFSLSELFVA